jgi:hypothetical protein
MIDLAKYGTASEVAEAVGEPRTTLITAANRGEIETAKTHGGTLLISVVDARKWSKKTRKVGPKFKADRSG